MLSSSGSQPGCGTSVLTFFAGGCGPGVSVGRRRGLIDGGVIGGGGMSLPGGGGGSGVDASSFLRLALFNFCTA